MIGLRDFVQFGLVLLTLDKPKRGWEYFLFQIQPTDSEKCLGRYGVIYEMLVWRALKHANVRRKYGDACGLAYYSEPDFV